MYVFDFDNKTFFLRSMSEWFYEGSCDTEDWSNDFENVDLPSQK